jgi:hypothetical protein
MRRGGNSRFARLAAVVDGSADQAPVPAPAVSLLSFNALPTMHGHSMTEGDYDFDVHPSDAPAVEVQPADVNDIQVHTVAGGVDQRAEPSLPPLPPRTGSSVNWSLPLTSLPTPRALSPRGPSRSAMDTLPRSTSRLRMPHQGGATAASGANADAVEHPGAMSRTRSLNQE